MSEPVGRLDDKLMTLAEVSEMTRVPTGTLYAWRSAGAGDGPASFKVGRRVVYWRSTVLAWLARQEAGTGSS